MKKYFVLIILITIILAFIVFFFFRNNLFSSPNNNISATKLGVSINSTFENTFNDTSSKIQKKEEELATFSTEIKDDSQGRLTNINISCSVLNNTIVKAGEEFSFNDIVGKPSSEKGYQEATIIVDGEHEKGIGGGNCQVSSTLYNAILEVPTLEVTERNEHGLPVTYVPEGKDAAVSYGSLDLKFKNNSNRDIRIEMYSDNTTITAKLIRTIIFF